MARKIDSCKPVNQIPITCTECGHRDIISFDVIQFQWRWFPLVVVDVYQCEHCGTCYTVKEDDTLAR